MGNVSPLISQNIYWTRVGEKGLIPTEQMLYSMCGLGKFLGTTFLYLFILIFFVGGVTRLSLLTF